MKQYPSTFKDWMKEQYGENFRTTCSDIAEHGCACGFSGLTYYKDTCALYEEYQDEIWDALDEDADASGENSPLALVESFNGAENVGSDDQFRNLLVWYLAERIADEIRNEDEKDENSF